MALEDELDLLLFDRTLAGMTLTPAGRKLLAEAEKVLAAAQVLQAEARSLKGEVGGKVTLGSLSDPEFIRLGEFMTAAVERYPLLEIEFKHEITGLALELREGTPMVYYGALNGSWCRQVIARDRLSRRRAGCGRSCRTRGLGRNRRGTRILPPDEYYSSACATLFRKHGGSRKADWRTTDGVARW
jgi:DNA-binding transcriptional LysR family regulator